MGKNTYQQLMKEIKDGTFAPVYWLEGEEPFFIDQLTDALRREVLPEEERTFNEWITYGKETQIKQLINQARQYPMGAERRLIIVKQAQQLNGWKEEQSTTLFASYLEQPAPFTVLALCVDLSTKASFTSQKKIRASINKYAHCFESKKVYDNQLPNWISSYVSSTGHQLTHKAIALICESVGNDLHRIAHELNKLVINHSKDAPITEEQIEKQIGISKDFNIFELQKALSAKQKEKAYQIMSYLTLSADRSAVLMINMLFQYFLRLAKYHTLSSKYKSNELAKQIGVHPYFLQEYKQATTHYPLQKVWQKIEYIQEADLRVKGLYGYKPKESELLKELIYQLLR